MTLGPDHELHLHRLHTMKEELQAAANQLEVPPGVAVCELFARWLEELLIDLHEYQSSEL